jgi:uncharacterized membrane protein YfcA
MEVTFWEQKFKVNLWIGCIGAFLVAIVSSMFGFGGGPFMTPLMAVGLGLPMYIVVGSSLLAIAFNTVIGSVQHWRYGNLDVLLFAVMFVAAILGGYIGPQIAKRLNPLVVKRVAAVGLIILALKLLNVY